ncbi:hypothetical protein GGR57DRAFT_181758 [Xylariaceae sp. FL1272]|nr:hypothetical protein GGR57DRAFT_181758 [Xylariaceae sp. FL1272]
MMQNSQAADGPLEDRLRNLILTNSNQEARHDTTSSRAQLMTRDGVQPDETPSTPAQKPAKTSRKRPNQAQRRQMNAELVVPVDTRPSFPPSYSTPRHFNDSHRHHHQNAQNGRFDSQANNDPAGFRGRGSARGDHPQFSRGHAHQGFAQYSTPSSHRHSTWVRQQPGAIDNTNRGTVVMNSFSSRGEQYLQQPQHNALYKPQGFRHVSFSPEQLANQAALLDEICHRIIAGTEISPAEIAEKEQFREQVERICRGVVHSYANENVDIYSSYHEECEFPSELVQLKCFGSLASGFATKAADMDLGLLCPTLDVSPNSPNSPIPRLIEKALLDSGFGARLLTKTRVPIIKLCQKPSEKLRQSLVDARVKWERGINEEDRHGEEDVDAVHEHDHPVGDHPLAEEASAPDHSPETASSTKPASIHEDQLPTLRQTKDQSLPGYYGSANRVLRRLKGRDVTQTNSHDFTEAEYALLDNVTHAFIHGLRDEDLRDRILAYPSLRVGNAAGSPNFRSLLGAYTIVEGEKVVVLWETKELIPSTPTQHEELAKRVQRWKDLQYAKSFGTNPVWFNKELQLSLDSLRKIPSIQLICLQQDQNELPRAYHARAHAIASGLQDTALLPNPDIHYKIIESYVNGIRDERIRKEVHEFANSAQTQNLRTVARSHKALHLAAEYERALEKGAYADEHIPLIAKYITILRRFPIRPGILHPSSADFEYMIPLLQDETSLVESIRYLPDPSSLGPNKPKDRYSDSLEFPKSGVGVQCDINFSAHLALHNTALLRCYSHTDPRVRPLVLFVKHWAKARGINTPYRGTLSSYGYVLMMLHYLVNVVEPFVCPNLQQLAPPDPPNVPPEYLERIVSCQGRNIRFWKDEQSIQALAQQGQLNQNSDSLGTLLRGFFEYYAQNNMMSALPKRGFDWGRDVLSIRTHGGLLTKTEKGWTGAKTVMQPQTGAAPPAPLELDTTITQSPAMTNHKDDHQPDSEQPSSPTPQATSEQAVKAKDVKEIRHRYLFAIEDPFELDHNVARTVTHNGIVAIRDEFRRAWKLIKAAGRTGRVAEDLLEDMKMEKEQQGKKEFLSLLHEIHGDMFFSSLSAN